MHFVGKINYSACSKFLFSCEGNLSFYHIRNQYATQEMQCMYKHNIAAHSCTPFAVDKQVLHNLSVCTCSPKYAACNAHALYCHL